MKVAIEIVHSFYQQIDFRVKQQTDIEQRPYFQDVESDKQFKKEDQHQENNYQLSQNSFKDSHDWKPIPDLLFDDRRSYQVKETGDFRPDEYGNMRFQQDLPLKKISFKMHPNIDVGDGGSYYYGGLMPLTTSFKPSFASDVTKQLPYMDLTSTIANSYIKAAPLNKQLEHKPLVTDLRVSRQEVKQDIDQNQSTELQYKPKNSLTTKQLADVLRLRQKLAADGVLLSSYDAVEKGICIDEAERDLTYIVTNKKYPYPNEFLMHNPFTEEQPEKKKKKRKVK